MKIREGRDGQTKRDHQKEASLTDLSKSKRKPKHISRTLTWNNNRH